MKGQLRIGTLYAFIVVDKDGTEGVPAFQSGPMLVPMMGADVLKATQLLPVAAQVAREQKQSVELVHFGDRRHVDWIDPPGGPRRPPEPPKPTPGPFVGSHVSVPYTTFSEPVIAPEDSVVSEGVWVAGTMVDGEPAIAISYLVDGKWQPALVVSGKVAEDLAILASDGLTAVRRTQN